MVNGITLNRTASHAVTLRLSSGYDPAAVETTAPLSEREQSQAARLSDAARRQAFVTGRKLAKLAVAGHLEQPELASRIEIVGHSPEETTSRPVALLDGRPVDICVSISHTHDLVAAAVAEAELGVGIDIARIEQLSAGFLNFWMTPFEQSQITNSECPNLAATKNWTAREAAFKLTQQDEAFRPADWSASFDAGHCSVAYGGQHLSAYFRFLTIAEDMLLAIATGGMEPASLNFEPFCFESH